MALQYNDMLKLCKTVMKANPSAPIAYSFGDEKFSYDDMHETLRREFQALAPTYRDFEENKNTIFRLMEETFEDVLPERVMQNYGQFAEIKTFAQGDRPIFLQRITNASKRRAKQFIGKVGLNGMYEAFKLSGQAYEVTTNAIGGAARIGFEEFLDGRVNMADVLDIVLQGIDECIYVEIEKQLIGAAELVPTPNKVSKNAFVEADMDKLISIADSYGKSTIYCTFEFAATMVPSGGWEAFSDGMKQQKWDNGYLATYKSHNVVVLPQSYEDETNKVKVIDPSYAFIIPVGAEKPVKIALEGGTIVRDFTGYDNSQEVQIYKKIGVRAIFSNSICIYQNTSLKRTVGGSI